MARSPFPKALAIGVAAGLSIAIFTIWHAGIGGTLEALRNARGSLIALYLLVSVLIAALLTLKWHVALDAYGVRMPFYTLFTYRLIGFAVSYVTPSAHVGGEPVRAMLVHRDGIPAKVSFSAVVADKSLELLCNVVLFFLGAMLILSVAEFPLAARITIMTLSLLAVVLGALFLRGIVRKKPLFVPVLKLLRFHKRKGWRRLEQQVIETERLIEHFYKRRKQHFALSLLIIAALWALMFLEYRLALLILGYEASPYHIFLFLTGVGIAYLLPIPAALGALELGQVSASAVLGISAAIGAGLAIIVRLRDVLWTLLGLAMLGMLRLNLFSLHERSRKAARRYDESLLREVEG